MDLDKIIPHFGEPVSLSALGKMLEGMGINVEQELRLQEGEYREYIGRPMEGYSLVFTDEAMHLGKSKQALGTGPLYFSGVFLYAQGKDGYSQFCGKIPLGIDFSMDHDALVALLGPPSWQRKRDDETVAADRWDDKPAFRIHVTYSKKGGKPVLISLQRPDAELR